MSLIFDDTEGSMQRATTTGIAQTLSVILFFVLGGIADAFMSPMEIISDKINWRTAARGLETFVPARLWESFVQASLQGLYVDKSSVKHCSKKHV